MTDDLKGRLRKAWKAYVQARLREEPELGPDDIKDKDVALLIEKRLGGEAFSAQTFSKIKNGRQNPSGRQLAAIAAELGADYNTLAGLKGVARDLRGGDGGAAGEKGA